jgi:hypothetical protein
MWKSTNIGADKLEIHPTDPNFLSGTYYIGVFAYKPGLNTFKVTAAYAHANDIVDLADSYTGEIPEWSYFKFPIQHPGESRIELILSPGKGELAMFVSNNLYYPNTLDHQWSLGMYEKNNILDEEIYDTEFCIDPDPYDKIMKRNYTRKPTAKEFERIRETEEEETESSALEKLDLDKGEPLRLCIDTDDWKYTNPVCYVGVKNLTTAPLSFSITKREVLEDDLLDPAILDKFRFFNTIYQHVEGSSISQSERKRLKVTGFSEYTYGEIDFAHIAPVFDLCKPKPGEVFWDLGCGAGKCMLTAALLYPYLKAVKGVEKLPKLYECCKETLDSLSSPCEGAPITVHEGDMLEVDWSDADIIFTSSICFPSELIEGMLEKAKKLKKGARFITLKSFPPNEVFEQKFNLRVKMTWGKTGVYILEKIID